MKIIIEEKALLVNSTRLRLPYRARCAKIAMMKIFGAAIFVFSLCAFAHSAEVKFIYYDEDFFIEDISVAQKTSDKKLKTDFIPWLRRQFYNSSEKETVAKQMLSVDWGMLAKGFWRGGLGLGMSFEKQIIPHLSAGAYFGQAVVFNNSDDGGGVTFSPAAFVYYYPISRQLRKLYLAAGFCWDSIIYFGDNIPNGASATSFSIYPQAGWKFSLPWRFLLDIYAGYKFAFNKNGIFYGNSADLLGFGFQWGIGFKHYMKERGQRS